MSTTTTTTSMKPRKPKWHPTPPPPPSPKILHLPRRTRRKQPKSTTKKQPSSTTTTETHYSSYKPSHLLHKNHQHYYYYYNSNKGKLENLFGQEREFSRSDDIPIVLLNSSSSATDERRERVDDDDDEEKIVKEDTGGGGGGGGFVEEKWKFQAEILRAECKFLRMEREFALKKLERNKKQMERALRSAVQTLLSGRESDGKKVTAVLKEEVEDLAETLKKLQKSPRSNYVDLRKCNNFDKEACRLEQQVEKLGGLSDEKCTKEMQEIAESNLSTEMNLDPDKESQISGQNNEAKSTDAELSRGKVGGVPKGMLDRMEEEYGSLLSTTADSSVASSASTSKRMECPDFSGSLSRHLHQERTLSEENKCSGRCKAVVRRIVEQVRTETEQWSQMQEMLGQVRGEMEELQASRDLWETRALKADHEIEVLKSSVKEWKDRAFNFEVKANELQSELSKLKAAPAFSRTESVKEQKREGIMSPQHLPLVSLGKFLEKETCKRDSDVKVRRHHNIDPQHQRGAVNAERDKEVTRSRELPPLSLGKQLAKEKRLLMHRLKGNRYNDAEKGSKQELLTDGRRKAQVGTNGVVTRERLPLRDIGNSSPLVKQNAKAVYPLHSPKHSKIGESLRKVLDTKNSLMN